MTEHNIHPGEEFDETLKGLDAVKEAPIAPAHGIASVALSMAMKYHDISTIKDGVMYQQYKMEGRNLHEIQIDHVFETAAKIELWLLGASDRFAKIIVDAMEIAVEDDKPDEQERKE
jgi:hypothetical protein